MKGINDAMLFFTIILVAFILGGFSYLSSFNTCEPQPVAGNTAAIIEDSFEVKIVTRVIDGDTVVIEGGESVRLLGIDADERGDPCYSDAKSRLEELVLNKEVVLESDVEDKDFYGRYLRHIIVDGENVNKKLVEEGFAIARFYSDVRYKEEIVAAEKSAMNNKIGCKWNSDG